MGILKFPLDKFDRVVIMRAKKGGEKE